MLILFIYLFIFALASDKHIKHLIHVNKHEHQG